MESGRISQTAMGTVLLRAAHQLLDAPPRILEDPAAVRLIGPEAAERIRRAPERFQTEERRALRTEVVLRSRYAEDRLASSLARGVRQYIILGAGFDTFAWRQPPWAAEMRIVEVDQPETQKEKLAQLRAAGMALPANVSFLGVDLERESLEAGLRRAPAAMDRAAFFSWLGVTMYLDEAAVDAVLRTVGRFPAGSEIVFTFAQPGGRVSASIGRRAADHGEPWKSRFTPEAISRKLADSGFSRVEFLSPVDAMERYFRGRPDDLPHPARLGIVSAVR